jgi:hypothetical protein
MRIMPPMIKRIILEIVYVKNVLNEKKIKDNMRKLPRKSPIEIDIPDQKFFVKTLLTISKKIGPGIAAIENPIRMLSNAPINDYRISNYLNPKDTESVPSNNCFGFVQ